MMQALDFDDALATAVQHALDAAHGTRRSRLLTVAEVRDCAADAATSPIGLAWRHAGETGDPRAQTTLCLCVRRRDGVAIGVASTRAQEPNPSRAWRTIPVWDRNDDAVNAARVSSWAATAPFVARFKKTTPTDEAALREAIRARPDDDAARLVYADWLSEHGDPRGEFIAIQCAGGDASELLERHGPEWSRGLDVRFTRGFASSVTLQSSAQLDELTTFAPREFVTHLVVNCIVNERVLAVSPWLAWLRQLEFRTTAGVLGPQRLKQVLDSPLLGALECLVLEHQQVRDTGLEHLAAARLPRLRTLTIEDDFVGVPGVAALTNAKWFPQLETLSLSHNALGPEGVATLARRHSHLKRLRLDHVRCGDEGIRALLESNCLPSLEALSVERNRLSARTEEWLRDAGFPLRQASP